jgi:hypothetical protein
MVIVEATAFEADKTDKKERIERSRIFGMFNEDQSLAITELLNSDVFSKEEKNAVLFNIIDIKKSASSIHQILENAKEE